VPFVPGRSRALALVLLALVAATTLVGQPAAAYPGAPWFKPSSVYTSNFPDPSIVRDGSTYYAYGTSTGGAYLPVMSSTDIRTWIARPKYDPGPPLNSDPFFNDALRTPAQWAPDRPVGGRLKKEIWAPGAAKIGSRFVVFYSVRQRLDRDRFCISVATSTSPLGPFDDNTPGPLVCDADPNGSIDPQPFVDPADNKPYLIWKSEGVPGSMPTRIWAQQLNSAGTGFAAGSSARELLRTSQAWEGSVIENPAMVRFGGKLYLFYSGNEHLSGSYATGYAVCSSMAGPCTKSSRNPILASRNGRLGPGGPAPFVDGANRLQLAYHYWNAPFTNYPTDPGCDGTDPDTGAPLCASQGQRRMAVEQVFVESTGLRVGGASPLPTVTARAIDDSCPTGEFDANRFPDVPSGNTHRHAIDCIAWWGITTGRGNGTYDPGAGVTRAEMATFIARLIERSQGSLPADPPDAFTDDENTGGHEININKLAAVGIAGGKGDGFFDPNARVNREQMATFLVRAYEYRSGKTLATGSNYFPDDNGSVHEVNINKAGRAGFTAGRGDGSYGPRAGVQRDQMASFLARVLDLLVEEGTANTP